MGSDRRQTEDPERGRFGARPLIAARRLLTDRMFDMLISRAVGLPRLRVHWVRPEIVVQVAFLEWTTNDKLRHPRLLGVRPDKSAREVTRERA